MSWYLVLPVNISRNGDVILAVTTTSTDALPLCYVSLNNCWGKLYVITTKGNLIVRRKGNSGGISKT